MVTFARMIVVVVGVVGLAACSDHSSMATSPSMVPGSSGATGSAMQGTGMQEAALSVSDAKVIVGGVAVQGPVRVGTDEPARFEVRVAAPQGLSTVGRVLMSFLTPNHAN